MRHPSYVKVVWKGAPPGTPAPAQTAPELPGAVTKEVLEREQVVQIAEPAQVRWIPILSSPVSPSKCCSVYAMEATPSCAFWVVLALNQVVRGLVPCSVRFRTLALSGDPWICNFGFCAGLSLWRTAPRGQTAALRSGR